MDAATPDVLQFGALGLLAVLMMFILRQMQGTASFTENLTKEALDGMRKSNEALAQVVRESSEANRRVAERLDQMRDEIAKDREERKNERLSLEGDHREIMMRLNNIQDR